MNRAEAKARRLVRREKRFQNSLSASTEVGFADCVQLPANLTVEQINLILRTSRHFPNQRFTNNTCAEPRSRR